jgi:hypothetical protein
MIFDLRYDGGLTAVADVELIFGIPLVVFFKLKLLSTKVRKITLL